MDWVIEGVKQAEQEHQITTRLIASVNRHENVELAAQVAEQAAERIEQGVVGIDLAGDEVGFSAEPFAQVVQRAKQNGLHATIHAGEWNTGSNVTQAIELLGAERIGHGIRVLEDPQAVELARKQNIPFEVCISSNYQSGAVSTLSEHPLHDMLQAGLYVTINTDDPSISQIELSDEYRLACESLGLTLEELSERVICAAQASFLPETERQRLVQTLANDYAKILA
jgi:adenosine deaminase